ncbi:MAG: tRNA(Ile2) 2-agmatinylcytidine synthetase [Methanomicrobiales archaeon]|jgi:methanogenesis imperfect marker protein 11|nr:tRNA(Ile2) 2-agmatinylcytidine synthetase [Methanomicrobiales archaeon]
MEVFTPDEIQKRFGRLFSQRLLVMVDEKAGRAEILEECRCRGSIEWDVMNRKRAGGAVIGITVEGTSMTMQAKIGHYPGRFGPADKELGGQALEGVEIRGDEVVTSWAGIAGAGVGVAACLPQAPGVIRTEYESPDDLKIGGARINRSRIVTPRYEKVTIGIDDTDTKEDGATWVLASQCAEACLIEGVEYLNMRLIQLNPRVPEKTTNCVGSALNFAVRPDKIEELLCYVRDFIQKNAVSDDTGIAVYHGIGLPEESPYMAKVKTEILNQEECEAEAARLGITFIDTCAGKGRIGALGSVLWANKGIEAAGLYGEHL